MYRLITPRTVRTELRRLATGKHTVSPVALIADMARAELGTADKALTVQAELRKLSKGKPATTAASFIARLALDALRENDTDKALDELERMYRLPDSRA